MELIFPFQNIVWNTLWEYYEREKIKDFSDFTFDKFSLGKSSFYEQVQRFRDSLPNLENEILQILNTTDKDTIDEYFIYLLGQLSFIEERTTNDYFRQNIIVWNREQLQLYTEFIEKEEESYLKQENRKRKHLEEYEEYVFNPYYRSHSPEGGFGKKVRRINYNYYCVENLPELIDIAIVGDYLDLVQQLFNELSDLCGRYSEPWKEGKLKSKIEEKYMPKPIVFVEGDHDITFIKVAAGYLNKLDLLNRIELRQRGGFRNLDKLWDTLKGESWETIPQTKIFLYDCDTNKSNESFGIHYKRLIPTRTDALITKGIENLLPDAIVKRAILEKPAYVDFKTVSGTRRGKPYREYHHEINKDEKKNFCNWVCQNAKGEDFNGFAVIFEIIETVL